MIQKVTAANASEHEPHYWVTEASDLQIPPGEFPEQLATDLGNGRPFLLEDYKAEKAIYKQSLGCLTLKVFND